jgi:hypothetical protein
MHTHTHLLVGQRAAAQLPLALLRLQPPVVHHLGALYRQHQPGVHVQVDGFVGSQQLVDLLSVTVCGKQQ